MKVGDILNGYERLKSMFRTEHQNTDKPLIRIITYLLHQPEMSEYYLKEEKNFKKMNEYLHDKAREFATNNVAIIEDETVYKWALEYFSKSDEELGINKPKAATPPKATKTEIKKDEDKNQLALEFA